MKLTMAHIDEQMIQVLSDPEADEVVVRMPGMTWGLLLTAAAQYYEMSAVNAADVLDRLSPSPSIEEIDEVVKALRADARAVTTLLMDLSA